MKPKLSKPTLESWRTSEEYLKKVVNHLNKKLFDIHAWKFHIPGQDRNVTYKEICENIQCKVPRMEWIDAIRSWFKYFPADLERMKENMNNILIEHSEKIEQQVNFIKEQDEYIERMESELDLLREKTSKIENEYEKMKFKEREEMLNKKQEEFNTLFQSFNESLRQMTFPQMNPIPVADQNTLNAMQQLNNQIPSGIDTNALKKTPKPNQSRAKAQNKEQPEKKLYKSNKPNHKRSYA